jgi:hypothetical protein
MLFRNCNPKAIIMRICDPTLWPILIRFNSWLLCRADYKLKGKNFRVANPEEQLKIITFYIENDSILCLKIYSII